MSAFMNHSSSSLIGRQGQLPALLRRTFIHAPGIDRRAEYALWERGCVDWKDFLLRPEFHFAAGNERAAALRVIEASIRAYDRREPRFFADRLESAESWRAWIDFRSSCAYLDIETDGRTSGDAITLIGLYDGQDYRAFVRGENMDSFRDAVSHYALVVTFFGTGFDLPMLRKRFPDLPFDQIHFDLCPALRRLGYRGGLKRIERDLGLGRSSVTEGLDGRDAIRLWQAWQRGSREALDVLITYNREDVVNLEPLAEFTYANLAASLLDPPYRRRHS